MFQHILVPLDGSFRAEQALPVASRIARSTGGSVLLLQVVSPPIDYSGGLAMVPLVTEQVIESEIAEATGYLKQLPHHRYWQGSLREPRSCLGHPPCILLQLPRHMGPILSCYAAVGEPGSLVGLWAVSPTRLSTKVQCQSSCFARAKLILSCPA